MNRRVFLQGVAFGLSGMTAIEEVPVAALQGKVKAVELGGLPADAEDAVPGRVKNRSIVPVRHWTGKFIWCKGEAKPYHFYLFARRTFDLSHVPTSARLHITASDRYVLFVNG